jgi:ribosomal protein S8
MSFLDTNDTIIMLKNAILRKNSCVVIPYSFSNQQLVITLTKAGFIRGFCIVSEKKLLVFFKYDVNFIPTIAELTSVTMVGKKYSLSKKQIKKAKKAYCFHVFSRPSKKFFPKFGNCLSIIK